MSSLSRRSRSEASTSSSSTVSSAGSPSSPATPDGADDTLTTLLGHRKRGRPKGCNEHPVHKLFNYCEDSDESRCIISGCTAKIPKRHAGNLMSHLKIHHTAVHANVLKDVATLNPGTKMVRTAKRATLNGVLMSGPVLQVHCLRLVTEHGLSFAVLDYSALQDIVQPYIEAMLASERVTISSHAMKEKIPHLAKSVREKIIAEVEGQMVSLKVDGCSRGNRHFIGINIQFGKGARVVVRTLAVEELHVPSTAYNLHVVIGIVLKRFRIRPKQIVAFTSDNGANYILAGKLLGAVDDDDAHDDNDDLSAVLQAQLAEQGDQDQEVAVEDEDLELGGAEWLDVAVDLPLDDFKMQSVRCAEHTLQLSVDDGLKSQRTLKPTIDKVRKLAKYLLNASQARQLKAAGKALPTLDVCTRWGSTFDMLQSVFRLREYVELTLDWSDRRDRTTHLLNDDEWTTVESLISDLYPLRKATKQLQREDLTLGEFFAIWSTVVLALEKSASALAQSLLAAMEKRSRAVAYRERNRGERLSPLFHYPGFNAAVFLDPRYFSLLSPDQVEDAKTYLVELWQRMQLVRGVAVVDDAGLSSNSDDGLDEDEDDASSAFTQLLARRNKERLQSSGAAQRQSSSSRRSKLTLREMLDKYDRETSPLPSTSDVFQYWEQQRLISPELYDLAMVVLSIPATQVSVERLFSALNFILRPQRFGLTSQHVDDVAFLRANRDVLRELVKDFLKTKPMSPEPLADGE